MTDLWYYSHEQRKIGPCSSQRLRELATCGRLLPTCTIWKEGIVRGVLASKVKNLFQLVSVVVAEAPAVVPLLAPPVDQVAVAPAETPPAPVAEPEIAAAQRETRVDETATPPPAPRPVAEAEAPAPPVVSNWRSQEPRKARATAGKGAIVVGQDGVTVKFRKKCVTCKHEDSSWNTLPIRNGMMRVGFYCPKCRKNRDVEIHGSLN